MKVKKPMSYEEFIIHCNNISSCRGCVYAPKDKKACYKLYCNMFKHNKMKKGEHK